MYDILLIRDNTSFFINSLSKDIIFMNYHIVCCLQAYHVTDSAIAAFSPKNNSALSTLKLTSCWELTNQTVLHIGKNLSVYYIKSILNLKFLMLL